MASRALVMGILNVTPDSFADGGRYLDPALAVDRVAQLVDEGTDIIDIGAESTRPGADEVPEDEEIRRLKPVMAAVGRRATVPISVDTRNAAVASMALDLGASIVNDISALRHDPEMAGVVANAGAGVVLMHMQGEPRTMQEAPVYANVVGEVRQFLADRVEAAMNAGIARERIMLDPGIGFGKTVDQNLALIRRSHEFVALGRPVVLGVSNKSCIGAILDKGVSGRYFGTLAAIAIAVRQGVHIVRVHTIDQLHDVLKVAVALRDAGADETSTPEDRL